MSGQSLNVHCRLEGPMISKSGMAVFVLRRLPRIAMLALVFGTSVCLAHTQPQPRRTALVVHWSPEEFPINPRRDAPIRKGLPGPSEPPAARFSGYLKSDPFGGPLPAHPLPDY